MEESKIEMIKQAASDFELPPNLSMLEAIVKMGYEVKSGSTPQDGLTCETQ